jgi:hypothetical protein
LTQASKVDFCSTPFLTTVCISAIAFYCQSASIYIRFNKGVVCFAKMAELEQQNQMKVK